MTNNQKLKEALETALIILQKAGVPDNTHLIRALKDDLVRISKSVAEEQSKAGTNSIGGAKETTQVFDKAADMVAHAYRGLTSIDKANLINTCTGASMKGCQSIRLRLKPLEVDFLRDEDFQVTNIGDDKYIISWRHLVK